MTLRKFSLFLLVNTLGFFSVGICYALGVYTNAIPVVSDPYFDAAAFGQSFFGGTLTTWLICAVFSLSYFFLEHKIRLALLWAPVVIPFFYGLSVLYAAAAS